MRRAGGLSRATSLCIVATALFLVSCAAYGSAPTASQSGASDAPLPCASVKVSRLGSEDAPDFAGYGYPRVAATHPYVPGQQSTVTVPNIVLTLPADMYTEPLEFELLVSDLDAWQACVPSNQVALAPYAFRVKEANGGKPVGRFDKPAIAAITDPRISASAKYWITTSTDPVTAEASASGVTVEGTTLKVPNGSARRGWFVTAPKA